MNPTICSYFFRGSSPFTSRASIDASALSGTTFCAWVPTYALFSPRIFSDGCCSSSTKFFPPPSGFAIPRLLAGLSPQPLFLQRAQRHHIVVITRNRHPPIRICHRRQQSRQFHRRIRCPISVMPAVQRTHWPIYGYVEADIPAIAEEQHRPPRRVHRPIAGGQQIRAKQILVRLHRALQI